MIKNVEKNPGWNIRPLAEQFECGKTQVAGILKEKKDYWLCMK